MGARAGTKTPGNPQKTPTTLQPAIAILNLTLLEGGLMRQRVALLGCVLLLASGCESYGRANRFPAPSSSPPLAPPRAAPFADRFRDITIGEVVRAMVGREDPLCTDWPQWSCQYFRITVPVDGRLEIVKTNTKGNLDLSFNDPAGHEWWYPITVLVTAGVTYQITIWEYEFPGVEFELRTSLVRND